MLSYYRMTLYDIHHIVIYIILKGKTKETSYRLWCSVSITLNSLF